MIPYGVNSKHLHTPVCYQIVHSAEIEQKFTPFGLDLLMYFVYGVFDTVVSQNENKICYQCHTDWCGNIAFFSLCV